MLRDRRRAAEGSLKLAAQALGNRDLAGIRSALRLLWDATEASDDRVLMAVRGHGHVVAGLGRMSIGEVSSSPAEMLEACNALLCLPPDADHLGLAHAIGECSNRIYRREMHHHYEFKSQGLFEILLTHILQPASRAHLAASIQGGPTENESARLALLTLRLSRGLVTPDSAASVAVSEVHRRRPLLFVNLDSCVLRQTAVGGEVSPFDALLDEGASAERVESLLATKPTLPHMSSHFEVDHADVSRSAFLLAGELRVGVGAVVGSSRPMRHAQ